ncbi:tRNA (adenine(22)-N(1))-methyltransferase [Sporolactobacillus spathodeae]|uniref:tRNA (Adenine22-N1)-methyltransferase n=1 Tax=Sporolactobacillus spathodeae TaxID=1465502 RepID=A0ABS2Q6X1_9BACL|nr:class I SAM-dependent methyltransferase [Sporolactobacillus spathodeae]MBM7657326.1 tRNA (adenine22-N1)-methyltransferase [Sporolactobacillus spathodeae]
MQTIHLTKRLQTVLSFIPKGARLADIGSDHAHLPCRAVSDKLVPSAIAGEVREGPYTQSIENVRAYGLEAQVDVRLGNGLDVLQPGEANAIVLAGMGGELITDILTRGRSKLAHGTILILQPNIRESHVRSWLLTNGWEIDDEAIVEEAPHFYEIIRAIKIGDARAQDCDESDLLMGPVLRKQKSATFRKKWLRRKKKLNEILAALQQTADSEMIRERSRDCLHQIRLIESSLGFSEQVETRE